MASEILLIAPSYLLEDVQLGGVDVGSMTPPLGILYVAGMLQQHGYRVNVLDMYASGVRTKSRLVKQLKQAKPDIIGISTLTSKFQNVTDIARISKEYFPNVSVILGGHFATFNHDKILTEYGDIDFIVRGEGEETTVELARELEKSKPTFSKIRGISYRNNGRLKYNTDRPLLADLDVLPFPAYELVADLSYGKLGLLQGTSGNLGTTVTSRGCVYKCTYCSNSSFTGHTIRFRSPENVVEELEYNVNTFGLREFMFNDDNFTLNKKRVLKLCHMLRKNRLDIEWYADGRVNQSDDTLYREMHRAGCRLIYFGIESCVDRILKYYRKGTTYEMQLKGVDKARKAKLDIVGSFILGAPIETIEEMWATIKKATALDLDYAQFNPLSIYRGTPIWSQLVKEGLIDDATRWEETISGFELNPHVRLEDLPRLMNDMHRYYFQRPAFIFRQLFRLFVYRPRLVFRNLRNFRNPQAIHEEIKRALYLTPPEWGYCWLHE
ncbi:MAG: B12-binding domain-containing radical SAM protein [Candidatus Hermodarchaeia archaeon]|jgi:radical SAM superfamily enzyme YgiQ (UPF0313 family)